MFLMPESSHTASAAIGIEKLRFCVPGERMIAIHNRKVKFARFWSKRVNTAFPDLAYRWDSFQPR